MFFFFPQTDKMIAGENVVRTFETHYIDWNWGTQKTDSRGLIVNKYVKTK